MTRTDHPSPPGRGAPADGPSAAKLPRIARDVPADAVVRVPAR